MSLKQWIPGEDHSGLMVNEYGIPAFVKIDLEDYETARRQVNEARELLDRIEKLERSLREERSL